MVFNNVQKGFYYFPTPLPYRGVSEGIREMMYDCSSYNINFKVKKCCFEIEIKAEALSKASIYLKPLRGLFCKICDIRNFISILLRAQNFSWKDKLDLKKDAPWYERFCL